MTEQQPVMGDTYTWTFDPGSRIEVVSVGRKYAKVRVTQASGATWMKQQPLPFPDTFVKVATHA